MKTFKKLKIGDKLFCVDVIDLHLMIYEIKDIEDYTFPPDSICIDFREFELITIIGQAFEYFNVLKRDLKQNKQQHGFLIFYSDEQSAVRKLNVLMKEQENKK